jgi:hypothetical protein
MHTRLLGGLAGLIVIAAPTAATATPAATRYKNCSKLNAAYPHGVGKPGARDKTSGTPVTSFKRSASLYKANTHSDRDRDGIACEKA